MVRLDDANLGKWINISANPGLDPIKNATYQAKSDVIRVALLAKWGGVWVDATVMPGNPLEWWLKVDPQVGFFAFRYPHGYQAASYFLASTPGNYMISSWNNKSIDFWNKVDTFRVAPFGTHVESPKGFHNYFWGEYTDIKYGTWALKFAL
jgi:hypothetical protein